MINFLDKFFLRSNNLDYISQEIRRLTKKTPSNKIFDAIQSYSPDSEIRYVGGCVRKVIKKEKVDDIDLATNLEPKQVCEALKKKDIKYFETGIEHGTVTAVIDEYKFEITSLREDTFTDGRHAKVKFSKNWKEDSLRRDFTINSIYSDSEGNLFDPHNGKNDLEEGSIRFIGDVDTRIKEDYLRILRYIRFFLNYSKQPHDLEIIKKLKINIGGVSKLSKERLIDELKKILVLDKIEKLSKDKQCFDLILVIFPELINIKIFSNLKSYQKELLRKIDFIQILSLLIIDEKDNVDYFLYKYKLSKINQKRIKIIDSFYKNKINTKTFTEQKMNKIFYYQGREAVIDILLLRILKSKDFDKNLIELSNLYQNKILPSMPIGADILMSKYKISRGRELGIKLKMIEEEWVNNNFKISNQQIENIIKN